MVGLAPADSAWLVVVRTQLRRWSATFSPRYGSALRCARHWGVDGSHTGGYMTRILTETLLFSCQAAFVTGIVIAAASLII